MSKITRCSKCGGNVVEPAYPGDGAYPVAPMCSCDIRRIVREEIVAEKEREMWQRRNPYGDNL